jgi:hypothetical protein
MKLNFRTRTNILRLLVLIWMVFSTRLVTAQCPVGSTLNTAGTYNNGQTVCINTNFSGNITLNNGATMVISSGGNYTGNLDAKQGSTVKVHLGATLAPGNANNFAATLLTTGTISGNISVDDGASINNNGSFTWSASWNQNKALTVTNGGCGTMTFTQNTNVKANAQIINDGILNFSQGLTTDNGTVINNRGRITFNGDINIGGSFINQNKAVIKGSNNSISSSNVGDSLVNTGAITVNGGLTTSTRTRNEGLLVVGGSYTINGETFRINNSNAYVRIGGSFSNNGQVQGNGSLYIGAGIVNNQSIRGNGPGALLTVNKSSVPGTTSALNLNTGLASKDTTNYTATMASPVVCTVLAEKLSSLQGVYNNGQVQLNWLTYSQSNARSFTIEYSLDGQSFTVAGEIAAAGISDVTTPYSFVHSPAVTGTVFYRIRETELNGSYYYSNIVVVRTGNTLTIGTEVFPNPFKDILQISMQLEKAGMIQVALYNASGRLVSKIQQTGLLGRNTIVMSNLSALPPGVYLVQIKADNHTSFEKLIK